MRVLMSKTDLTAHGKALEQYRQELFKREYLPWVRALPYRLFPFRLVLIAALIFLGV
jgi:hypothetical protein